MIKALVLLSVVAGLTAQAQRRVSEPAKKGPEARVEEKARETGKSATGNAVETKPEEKAAARILQMPNPVQSRPTAESAVTVRTNAERAKPSSRAEVMERVLNFGGQLLGKNAVVAGTAEYNFLEAYADARLAEEARGQSVTLDVKKMYDLIKEIRNDKTLTTPEAKSAAIQRIVENVKVATDYFKNGKAPSVSDGLVKRMQELKPTEDPEQIRKDVENCGKLAA